MKLVIASQNPGKRQEFQTFLTGLGVECLLPSADFNLPVDLPNESGKSFAQNAEIKARLVFNQTQYPTVADDSGLVVSALGGFPGVISARWLAGSDRQRNEGLLKKLAGSADRTAEFMCVLCLVTPKNAKAYFFTGSLKGTIAQTKKGVAGFGYDSIFIPQGEIKTLAELGENYKNKYSHRIVALKKLSLFLSENMID